MAYDTTKLTNLGHLQSLAQKIVDQDYATNTEVTTAISTAVDGISIPEYTIVKASDSGDYSAVYNLTKDGTATGATINIPKDMVVSEGSVVENPEGYDAGTYIKLVLANSTADPIYIDVSTLIEYVTSGSAATDAIVIAVDETTHKVTASVTDGTITLANLAEAVQAEIAKAHTHDNKTVLDSITETDITNWNAASASVTTVTASTTQGNIVVNDEEVVVVSIATDAEVTEMLTEVFA